MNKKSPDDAATQGPTRLPSLAELVADNPGFLDEVVLPEEASRILKMPEATLSTLRCRGGGPEFVRLGPGKRAPVGYTRRKLFTYAIQRTRRSTSDPGQAAE